MHLKRYEVADMGEAIAQIKRDLGPDAIILSTRTIRQRSGLFSLGGKPLLEVVAAVDPQNREEIATTVPRALHGVEDTSPSAPRLIPPPLPQDAAAEMEALRQELRAMRDQLLALQASTKDMPPAPTKSRRLPKAILGLHQQLMARGLTAELAEQILDEVRGGRPAKALQDEAALRDTLLRTMIARVRGMKPHDASPSPRLMAFVGPSGVGKSTTIAKLAAIKALTERRRVALITLDTYRIAAAEQLKVYGNIIGTPVTVAADRHELERALRELREYDVVFIDTPGRCHRNSEHMWELKGLLTQPQALEIHLVLSATTREEEAEDMIRQFSLLPLHNLLFTKLDESGSLGSLFSLIVRTGKSVSYLTTGQRVPEDVEVATPERIVDLFWHGFWR